MYGLYIYQNARYNDKKFNLWCFVLVHRVLKFLPLLALVPGGSALCFLYVGVIRFTQTTAVVCQYLRTTPVKQRGNLKIINFFQFSFNNVGQDSVVGVATRYGVHGPGIESW